MQGEDCCVVINGDISQCDLDQATARGRPVIEFTLADIVRSGLCVDPRVRGGADVELLVGGM